MQWVAMEKFESMLKQELGPAEQVQQPSNNLMFHAVPPAEVKKERKKRVPPDWETWKAGIKAKSIDDLVKNHQEHLPEQGEWVPDRAGGSNTPSAKGTPAARFRMEGGQYIIRILEIKPKASYTVKYAPADYRAAKLAKMAAEAAAEGEDVQVQVVAPVAASSTAPAAAAPVPAQVPASAPEEAPAQSPGSGRASRSRTAGAPSPAAQAQAAAAAAPAATARPQRKSRR